ncbi:MAG: pentapeptide repeat-containing protein, partial [Tagaea sp.]|nr:pentapeptide repeat-containing protein [Tagaea sp.]
ATNLVRANFENSNLAPLVVASGKSLVTRLDRATLRHARFVGCQLVQTSFREADLRWSSFVDCETKGADFEQAIGRPASAVAAPETPAVP